MNLSVIVASSLLISTFTSSPIEGFRISYSSSVRHITAFVTRLFVLIIELINWIIGCITSLGMANVTSSSYPISTFTQSMVFPTDMTYMFMVGIEVLDLSLTFKVC